MPILHRLWTIFIDLVETLVIAGAIFVVIYAFLFRPFQVNGQSMFPNYHNGEYILTNLFILHFESLQRGDVIVFKAPPNQEKDFIKRIIGLPGDSVKIQDGSVYINSAQLDESGYLPQNARTFGGTFLPEGQEVVVPENNFFVLGDNRNFSSDSREWGFVSRDKVIGKSYIVYWPLNQFRTVPDVKYTQ